MSVFRLPNIGDGPEKEQLRQLKSYLYQLVEQLNMELGATQPGAAPTGENRESGQRNVEQKASPV